VKQSFVFQLVDRYVHSVIAVWPLLATAVGVALALVVLGRFGLLARVTGWRKAVVLALVSAGALWWAWQLRWLCDDAYISFRYADNWARGLGPVFNAGEKVEGYTNFLWTALLAVLIKLGAHPGQASLVISLGCFVGALLLLDRLALQVTYPEGRGLGIGALLAGASFLVANFATSGLETLPICTGVASRPQGAHAGKRP
jgi:arabinofuranosyltransferase